MFGGHEIDAITNGVHVGTWVSPPFARLFDRHIPAWRRDNFSLRYAGAFRRTRYGRRMSKPSYACWSSSTALGHPLSIRRS